MPWRWAGAVVVVAAVTFLTIPRYRHWRAVRADTDAGGSTTAATGTNGATGTDAPNAPGPSMINIATVPAVCPAPDDMAALETVVPGGSGAAHMGASNASAFGGLAGGLSGSAPAEQTAAPAKCRALSPKLEAAFHTIDSAAQAFSNLGYDEDARGRSLADANAIFAFVRDRIHTLAYAGTMRGGIGTLMNRSGSPVDKAMVLAQLLATKGIGVRFVHATLSDADVRRVIAAVLQARTPTPSKGTLVIPTSAIQNATGGTSTAQPIADQIVSALKSAGASVATSDAALRARWAANLRDHWWVQAQQGGKWMDLDPTLPGMTAGSHVGAAPSGDPSDQLPDTLNTNLTLRIVADRIEQGRVTTDTLVERTLHAADAYAQPVGAQVSDPDAKVADLGKSTSFTPSIIAGGGTTAGDAFQPDPTSGPRLLRLRLEITTARPGYPPLVDRRTMVDRSNAAGTAVAPGWDPQRTAYALTLRYDGLAQAGGFDPGFIAVREAEAMHALHAFLVYAANRPMYPLPQDAYQAFPLEVMHYFELDGMIRHQTEARSPNHTRFYFDRPVIAFVHHTISRKSSSIAARHDFDVVEGAMDAVGTNVAATVHDNIMRGVIDDAIEAHVTVPAGTITTRTVLDAAPASGVSIIALLPSASPSSLPTVARSAAAASLERGAIVATNGAVSIGGESHVGWWEVDPTTGSTIGRLESGAGQALSGYLATTDVALKASSIADMVGGLDACMFGNASAVLAGAGGGGGAAAVADCAKQVACEFIAGEAIGAAGDSVFDLSEDEDIKDLIDQLLDIDNDLWKTSEAVCEK